MSDTEHFKVLIIGSGPAGLTAALYASRANLAPLVLEGEQPGGQLTITTEVENYPGFPKGILGPELMDNFRDQARHFGTDVRQENVTEVNLDVRPFQVQASSMAMGTSKTYTAGRRDHRNGRLGDAARPPRGAAAHGSGRRRQRLRDLRRRPPPYRNQPLVVVGGGDTAMEEAMYLTKFASMVHVVHRRDELRASKIMQERAFANEKMTFEWNTVLKGYVLDEGNKYVVGASLEDTKVGRAAGAAMLRRLHRDRPQAQHPAVRGQAAHGRQRLPDHSRRPHGDGRPRRLRLRRRSGSLLPPGRDRRRHRVHGGHRVERWLSEQGIG